MNPDSVKGKKSNLFSSINIFNFLKGPWTAEEDLKVIELVQMYGPQKWTFVANHLPGRIGKQCRERYLNLKPKQIKIHPFKYLDGTII